MCQEHGHRRPSLPRCPARRPLGLSDCQAFSTSPATGPPPPGRLGPPWPPPNPSKGADVPSWQLSVPREGIQCFPRAQGEAQAEGQAVDEGSASSWLGGWCHWEPLSHCTLHVALCGRGPRHMTWKALRNHHLHLTLSEQVGGVGGPRQRTRGNAGQGPSQLRVIKRYLDLLGWLPGTRTLWNKAFVFEQGHIQ